MRNKLKYISISVIVLIVTVSCKNNTDKEMEKTTEDEVVLEKGTFGYDKAFLRKHLKNTIVLGNNDGKASIIVSPELQGRVMTSTLNGQKGMSFGWINYDLISSKKKLEHFNPTGGEERFWLGPEGGQFSIYFDKDKKFELENWYVPGALDTESFNVSKRNENSVSFEKEMKLTNYSGTQFNLKVNRTVSLLTKQEVIKNLDPFNDQFTVVAYETQNTITNIGDKEWNKNTGLLSIWLLCMMTPSDEVTVVAPILEGNEEEKGVKVNDNYFGEVAKDRLKSKEQHVFFKADGKSRGKIGITPLRATGYIGSYDAQNGILTILQIKTPKATDRYVNSAWEIQDDPYSGDVLNSYNDGPLEDRTQMGPFYELESSSPALTLASGESYNHTQRMYHFKASKEILDELSKELLKISIQDIEMVF